MDAAGNKGTGKWTSQSALDLGVPLSLITESVFARYISTYKEELLALLGDQPINAASIRNITYTLIREELARLYGTSVQEAADIIGNQLDCAPHEDISGYIFMVPNWAHKWFRHNVCSFLYRCSV